MATRILASGDDSVWIFGKAINLCSEKVAVKAASLANLPTELLVQILSQIPFTPANRSAVRGTAKLFDGIYRAQEATLALAFRRNKASDLNFALFPGLASTTYQELHTIYRRTSILEKQHRPYLLSLYADMDWMRGRWEMLHRAGALLLWYLHDVGVASRFGGGDSGHEAVVSAMEKLPLTSLSVVLFELISCVRVMRTAGPEPINDRYCSQDMEVRAHVELCLEEVLLKQGTDLFIELLQPDAKRDHAVKMLEAEMECREEQSAAEKKEMLILQLRRMMAEKMGVSESKVVTKMWEVLSGMTFDRMDEAKVEKLVKGEELEKEMRRMGY